MFYGLLALVPAITAFVSFYGLFATPSTINQHLTLLSDVLPGGGLDILQEQVTRHAALALQEATARMIEGQADDLALESRLDVSLEACIAMAAGKTGALISCAASLGAVLAAAPARQVSALADFGAHLGLAFQAVDDLLGIWGDPEATGKRPWSDLRQRKKSLPVVAALDAGGPASERLARILAEDAKKSETEIADFTEEEFASRAALIEEAGGRDWTSQEARRQHATAIAALNEIEMPEKVRAQLVALADFVVVRER